MSAGKKSSKEYKRLLHLRWDKVAYYAMVAISVTSSPEVVSCCWAKPAQMADPNYDPWLYLTARKNKPAPAYNTTGAPARSSPQDGYDFLYQPSTGQVYYRRFNSNGEFAILKQNRKAYKSAVKNLEKAEPKLKKITSGFMGTNILSSGYIYAPYVPMVKTPSTIDPNSFTPSKRLLSKYSKKLINPKFFNCMSIKGV
jgi:hypothetical protein